MKQHSPMRRFQRMMIRCGLILLMLLSVGAFVPIQAYAAKSIRVGVCSHLPPYQFRDTDGSLIGMHIDLMNAIAKEEDLKIQYVAYERNSDCLEALEKGDVDAILGIRTNDQGAAYFQSIGDISSSSLCMVERKVKLSDAYPQKTYSYDVAFESGTVSSYLLPRLSVNSYSLRSSQEELFQTLIDRDVIRVIGNWDSLTYQLNKAGIENNYYISYNYLASLSYTVFVQMSNRSLYNVLEQGLTRLRVNGEYDQIYKTWIVDKDLKDAQTRIKYLITTIVAVIGAAGLVIFMVHLTNKMLKRAVNEKTEELSVANQELAQKMGQLESESALRTLLIENAHIGILLLDRQGTVLMANGNACELAANRENAIIGTKIWEVPLFSALWTELEKEGKNTSKPRTLTLVQQGISCNYRCLYHRVGSSGQAILSMEDVTREEREKNALFEMEKNKSLNRIVAGIAHEIRNPLMAIRSFSSLIGTESSESKEFQESFSKCVPKEVDRINRLIESLINYSRPAKGQKELVSVPELMNECVNFSKVTAKNLPIAFRVKAVPDTRIIANKDQIRQALINLIFNGIESMEQRLTQEPLSEKLTLELSAFSKDGKTVIEVYDEGIGMTKEEIAKCTEQFYTTKARGSGLGMPLVEQFIRENSGVMSIESIKGVFTRITLQFEGATA